VARIIEDLLDLSRIEAEESPVREPVPVHLVVAEAVERVRPVAEVHGVVVDVAEPSRRLVVSGDRRQLVSALFNLLENAVKYSEPGGRVELRARSDGARVELAVRDEGIGIPARDLERIFERFYRVDRARSRQTGGTGLGLAIVRHVATNHGGEVTVESREGEGSVFRLVLPLAGGPVAVSSAS
jgi:two-component system sensor histidine kinase SenX3